MDTKTNKIICKELNKICRMLANSTKDKKQKKEFIKRAEIFKGLSKLKERKKKPLEIIKDGRNSIKS